MYKNSVPTSQRVQPCIRQYSQTML